MSAFDDWESDTESDDVNIDHVYLYSSLDPNKDYYILQIKGKRNHVSPKVIYLTFEEIQETKLVGLETIQSMDISSPTFWKLERWLLSDDFKNRWWYKFDLEQACPSKQFYGKCVRIHITN